MSQKQLEGRTLAAGWLTNFAIQKQFGDRTLAAGWLTNFAIPNRIRDRKSVLMYIFRKFWDFFLFFQKKTG